MGSGRGRALKSPEGRIARAAEDDGGAEGEASGNRRTTAQPDPPPLPPNLQEGANGGKIDSNHKSRTAGKNQDRAERKRRRGAVTSKPGSRRTVTARGRSR